MLRGAFLRFSPPLRIPETVSVVRITCNNVRERLSLPPRDFMARLNLDASLFRQLAYPSSASIGFVALRRANLVLHFESLRAALVFEPHDDHNRFAVYIFDPDTPAAAGLINSISRCIQSPHPVDFALIPLLHCPTGHTVLSMSQVKRSRTRSKKRGKGEANRGRSDEDEDSFEERHHRRRSSTSDFSQSLSASSLEVVPDDDAGGAVGASDSLPVSDVTYCGRRGREAMLSAAEKRLKTTGNGNGTRADGGSGSGVRKVSDTHAGAARAQRQQKSRGFLEVDDDDDDDASHERGRRDANCAAQKCEEAGDDVWKRVAVNAAGLNTSTHAAPGHRHADGAVCAHAQEEQMSPSDAFAAAVAATAAGSKGAGDGVAMPPSAQPLSAAAAQGEAKSARERVGAGFGTDAEDDRSDDDDKEKKATPEEILAAAAAVMSGKKPRKDGGRSGGRSRDSATRRDADGEDGTGGFLGSAFFDDDAEGDAKKVDGGGSGQRAEGGYRDGGDRESTAELGWMLPVSEELRAAGALSVAFAPRVVGEMLAAVLEISRRRLALLSATEAALLQSIDTRFKSQDLLRLVPLTGALNSFSSDLRSFITALDGRPRRAQLETRIAMDWLRARNDGAQLAPLRIDVLRCVCEEIELQFEDARRDAEEMLNGVDALAQRVRSFQTTANISLASARTKLLATNLKLTTMALALSVSGMVSNVFGMNLMSGFEEAEGAFEVVTVLILMIGTMVTVATHVYIVKPIAVKIHRPTQAAANIDVQFWQALDSPGFVSRLQRMKDEDAIAYAAAAVGEAKDDLPPEFRESFLMAARTGRVLEGSGGSSYGPTVKVNPLRSGTTN